ncbi:MAG: hypothetical protein ACYTFY_09440 [Planctomycetota bacterium]|jgi:hypothetical protein
MSKIKDKVLYTNLINFFPDNSNIDKLMRTACDNGITHIQVNHLPDNIHPAMYEYPDNFYLTFTTFGPSLDMFVDSELNCGIYPPFFLERNVEMLKKFTESALAHNLKPILYLCEPRFVPESLFRRHPQIRGARVDNPSFSTHPLYTLCVDCPEVLEHYSEMMGKVMKIVPELEFATIFTSDSGAGFDHNPHTYAGPNGARFNRFIPLEERVVKFLKALLDPARKYQSDFEVHLTSGFPPEERGRILNLAPEGIVGSVYGEYSWEGGLEGNWSYVQHKQNPVEINIDEDYEERFADMQQRFDLAKTGGRDPLVHCEMPTCDWPRPMTFIPHPFETVKITKGLIKLGSRRLSLWGRMNSRENFPYDCNREVFLATVDNPELSDKEIIRKTAAQWLPDTMLDNILKVWRLSGDAFIYRPNFSNNLTNADDSIPGPMVPAPDKLDAGESGYYRNVLMDYLNNARGGYGWFVPWEKDESVRDYVLNEMYDKITFPQFKSSMDLLQEMMQGAAAGVKEFLKNHYDHIHVASLWLRSSRNWYEAGRYLAPGDNPSLDREFKDIVDDEIAVTEKLIEVMDGRHERFVTCFTHDQMLGAPGPGLIEKFSARIAVMKRHRDDRVEPLKSVICNTRR